ncbi:MAG TPA: serine hydrolase [Pyrinomonadaceae bacterium]|nr:serine hydrolase [Pyrinomonadaceae bacterium]
MRRKSALQRGLVLLFSAWTTRLLRSSFRAVVVGRCAVVAWTIVVSLVLTLTSPVQTSNLPKKVETDAANLKTRAELKTNLQQSPTAELKTVLSVRGHEQTAGGVNLAQRIERIENGLLPPAVLKGETPVRMRLADRMQHYKTPGVSIAVINDGRIEWARGYGFLAAGGSEPVTTETLFQAASISKPVTAMAILRLVQQRKLSLDGDVNDTLLSWKIPENEFTKEQKVTLRRLLTHSAGVTVPGFLGYPAGEPLPNLRQILDGQPPANSAPIRVDILPGSKWRYAGGGYVVLQQLLMDVTGNSFPEFMQKMVLQKLGMTHSTFEQPLSPQRAVVAAAGHLPDGKEMKGKWFVYPEQAPAGLWTTPTDLARFVIELQKSRVGKSNKVLSTAMTKQMLTPQFENNGLGLFVEGQRFGFAGANVGFKCRMEGYMNREQGVVVMTNSENGAQLIAEILRSVAAEYGWPDFHPKEKVIAKVDPRVYDAYVGEYEIAPGFILTVIREGDKLMSRAMPVPVPPSATGQPWSEMFPESETIFFIKDADAKFTFVKDEQGKVVQVNIFRGGREYKARKIK